MTKGSCQRPGLGGLGLARAGAGSRERGGGGWARGSGRAGQAAEVDAGDGKMNKLSWFFHAGFSFPWYGDMLLQAECG